MSWVAKLSGTKIVKEVIEPESRKNPTRRDDRRVSLGDKAWRKVRREEKKNTKKNNGTRVVVDTILLRALENGIRL